MLRCKLLSFIFVNIKNICILLYYIRKKLPVYLKIMNVKELICPVSNERVNEKVVRCNALLTILLVATAIYFESQLLLLLLVADFYIRAFTTLKTSPLTYLSMNIVLWLKLGLKAIDKAPKIFAARLGFLMSLTILVLFLGGFLNAAFVISGILSLFALLELTIGFCAGCYIYSFVLDWLPGE